MQNQYEKGENVLVFWSFMSSEHNIADLRKSYERGELTEAKASANPLEQFESSAIMRDDDRVGLARKEDLFVLLC